MLIKQLPILDCGICGGCPDGALVGAKQGTVDAWNRAKRVSVHSRGHILFHEGSTSGGLYCISSGRLKLYRMGRGGELHIVRLSGPGQILGHPSLILNEPCSTTAEVIAEATVCFIDGPTVLESIDNDPAVAVNFMRILARSLESAEGQLLEIGHMTTCARVSSLLLQNREQDGVALPLTRQEIGQMIGATTESVSRVLQSLARIGAIRLEKRRIWVVDARELGYLATDPEEAWRI